jgi:DNA-binding PadR family transcriptional regulator
MREYGRGHRDRMFAFGSGWGPRFGPPGGGFGGHGHGRQRGRRGNVRAGILALLTERPMHGYEIIQELESRTGGVWRPSPGSVYPTLQLLEDEGLVTSEESGGRRRFTLTEAGRAEAAQAAEQAPWAEFAQENVSSWRDIQQAGFGAMNALRQVMMTGTEEQRTRAAAVLDEARRKLYAILAENEE